LRSNPTASSCPLYASHSGCCYSDSSGSNSRIFKLIVSRIRERIIPFKGKVSCGVLIRISGQKISCELIRHPGFPLGDTLHGRLLRCDTRQVHEPGNGDGRDTIGFYDPDNGIFYLRNSLSTGYADSTFGFGVPGANWKPVVGDP